MLAVSFSLLLLAVPGAGASDPPLERAGVGGERGEIAAPGDGPVTRIVGGGFTTTARYPWQVAVLISSDEGEFICGGTLIHPLIVMTAAHCLADEFGEFLPELEATLVIGRTTLSAGDGEVNGGFEFWKHSGYGPIFNLPAANAFDVAFITLDFPSLGPRLLIAGADERALWTPGRAAYVTGWGNTSEGGSSSDTLKEALVPIVADPDCATAYGSPFVASLMVCAGFAAGGVDSCQGDSGGPLQSPVDGGGFRLTGIVSWGEGCARPARPGVYARVAEDPLLSTIAGSIPFIEAAEGFADPFRGINVIGSGARPPGCAVADQQFASAAAVLAVAQGRLAKRQVVLRRKTKAVRRAKKAVVRVNRALRRVSKPKAKRRVRRAMRRAKRNLRRSRRAQAIAKRRRNMVRNQRNQAKAAETAASANRTAICG